MSIHQPPSSSQRRFPTSIKRNSWGILTKKPWSNLQSKLAKNLVPPTPPADVTEFDVDKDIPPSMLTRNVSIQIKPRNSLTLSESLTARISKNLGQFYPPTPTSPNGELYVDEESVSDSESRIGYVVSEAPCDFDSPNSSVSAISASESDRKSPISDAKPEAKPEVDIDDYDFEQDSDCDLHTETEPDEYSDSDDLDDNQLGPGLFAGLIQELNEDSGGLELDSKFTMTPQPKAGSMHRQISPKAPEEAAITFFSDTVPKRTSARLSTLSPSVFPIKEEPVAIDP